MNIQELIKELQKYADRPYNIRVRVYVDWSDHPDKPYRFASILGIDEDEGMLFIKTDD